LVPADKTAPSKANYSRGILGTLSAVTISGFLLASCITNDEYARQICLEKGLTGGGSAYSDCLTAQRAWIEDWQSRTSSSKPNG